MKSANMKPLRSQNQLQIQSSYNPTQVFEGILSAKGSIEKRQKVIGAQNLPGRAATFGSSIQFEPRSGLFSVPPEIQSTSAFDDVNYKG
jgi:hypothetical protein